MHLFKSKGVIVGAFICGLTGTLPAFGEAGAADVQSQMDALKAEVAELRAAKQEVQSLKSEVSQLKGASNEQWLNERRAEEVKALVKEVLADADTRASLLEGGAMTAGHNGKNFFLASEDGSFLLKIGGRIQVRYIANFGTRPNETSGVDNGEDGFQIRRFKPFFEGFIGSPKFEYRVVLAADRNTTTIGLEEAIIGYEVMDGLKVSGGRFKAPFLHEELISSGKQEAVERSVFNEIFTAGFTEGVQATYTTDSWRASGMINDGQNAGEISTGRQPTNSGVSGDDFNNDLTDIAGTARFDYRLAGEWKQWDEFAAWSSDELGLFVGGAVHYEIGETGSNSAPTVNNNNFVQFTVDAQMKMAGFNLYGAVAARHDTKREGSNGGSGTGSGSGSENFDDYGFEIQAGYFVIPDKLEPFARYELIMLDEDRAGADPCNILTIGANYYFRKHDVKFTVDCVWAMDPLTGANIAGTGISGLGLITDTADTNQQFAVRAQMQLQF
jgi:hypothetical protein